MIIQPNEPSRKDLLKAAYLKIEELKCRLEAASAQQKEPIAIVGMGCRFPNGANDPEAFWKVLRDGVDCLRDIPKDRWDIEDYYDPDPAAFGKMYVRRLGLLDDVRGFDPLFFRVSPREAAGMDPQQRVMLEVAWEALENSGQAPDQLTGSNTGVFVGVTTLDYGILSLLSAQEEDDEESRAHSATGISQSILAGRISYFLGLRGPCIAMDTACSSSVLAVHLACQSLRRGECTMALAGAVNLILAPIATVATCKSRLLAPDGKCKVFDESADGYARSEGCGVVVLKTLRDAQANGDRILGIIHGTACNQDGRSAGITAPNGNAQREVIQTALAASGLHPNQISFVETHGTGTRLGDPIEVQALGEVFAPGRPSDRPLLLGAVKSNVGHMEPAAGMAGVIKVLLAFQHGQIPPQLHLKDPNHHIPWNELPFLVPTSLTPWPAWDSRRLAGISCFGYSGTNTHMIVEQPPPVEPTVNPNDRSWHVLTLSALGEEPLLKLAQRYQEFLAGNPNASLADVCYTANTGRAHFPYRLALVASSVAVLEKQLQEFQATTAATDLVVHGTAPSSPPKVAFLFTEERVHPDLVRQLYEQAPPVRQALDRCDGYAQTLLGQSLLALLSPQPGEEEKTRELLRRPTYLQPALFALGYAYAELWISWGITPTHLVGHNVGEIVAGCVAGVFDLQEGMRLAVERGRWLETSPNGSGDPSLTTSVLHTNGEASRPYSPPRIPVLSTSLGRQVKEEEVCSRAYWRPASSGEARWQESIGVLRDASCQVYFEIGHDTIGLAKLVQPDFGEGKFRLSMFSEGKNPWRSVVRALAVLYCVGVPVSWAAFDRSYQRRKVALPTYPFQRQECWVTTGTTFNLLGKPKGLHPLLGRRLPSPHTKNPIVLEGQWDTRHQEFLKDHRYFSTLCAPSAVYLEMAQAAAKVAFGAGSHEVKDLVIQDPLTLVERRPRLTHFILTPGGTNEYSFTVWSAELEKEEVLENTWRQHASGSLQRGKIRTEPTVVQASALEEWRTRCSQVVEPRRFYDKLADCEIEYGPTFQVFSSLTRRTGEALAVLKPRPTQESDKNLGDYLLHPTLLEAAVQLLWLARQDLEAMDPEGDFYLAIQVEQYVARGGARGELHAHAILQPQTPGTKEFILGDVQLFDDAGKVVADVKGIKLNRRPRSQLQRQLSSSMVTRWMFETGWEKQAKVSAPPKAQGHWLIWADSMAWGSALAAQLQGRGAHCTLVREGDTFAALADGSFTCRPTVPEDFEHLIEKVGAANKLPNVVFLAVTDATLPSSGVPALATRECAGILHLVQSLARAENKEFGALAIVTRGAQATQAPEELVDLPTTALWGLGRVLASEIPDLHCRNIDLDPQVSQAKCVQALANELLATDLVENQVTLRQDERLVPRLTRWPQPGDVLQVPPLSSGESDGARISAQATYLVTGGLGGLGLLMADWLVEHGARRLILLGRSTPSASAEEYIGKLRTAGAEVIISRADVANREQLAEMISSQARADMPLRGVIHAAGVLDDGALLRQDLERFTKVLAPKISGGWNLHELTLDQPLDFFLLFSSSAALMGNPGQSSYSAGNTFMDGLAHKRHALGLPALSINWGPWGKVGMAASLDVRHKQEWAAMGIEVIEPYHGLAALELMLGQRSPQVAVLAIDEMKLRRLMVGRIVPPFLTRLMPQRDIQAQDKASRLQADVKDKLQQASPEQRKSVLLDLVRDIVREAFGFDPSRSVPLDQNLASMGMDSLLAIHLTNRLKNVLGHPLPLSLTMEYPTIGAISEYLNNTLPAPGTEAPSELLGERNGVEPEGKPAEPHQLDPLEAQRMLAQLDQIPDSDLDALLASLPEETVEK